jgi:hypothetical protein
MAIGVSNIERLRSNFADRGDFYQNDFSSRFGGGPFRNPFGSPFGSPFGASFPSAATIGNTFRDDAGDMVKKVVSSDTKSINNSIAGSLNQRIQDQIEKSEPTYTKPGDVTADAIMSMDQAEEFISKLQEDQESAKRINTTRLTEDSGIKNVAAALQTTEDSTLAGLGQFGLDSSTLETLRNLNLTGLDFSGVGMGAGYTPIEINQPSVGMGAGYTPIEINQPISETDTTSDTAQIPAVSQEFNDVVSEMFDNQDAAPEDYKLSKLNVTYTKVSPELDEDDLEEIESIDVSGTLAGARDEEDLDELESIDVRGRLAGDEDEEIDSVDVSGYREEDGEEQGPDLRRDEYGNDPWERFKALYADFYGGGRAGEVLSEYNRREEAGDFSSITSPKNLSLRKESDTLSPMSQDANMILNAKREKDQLMAITDMMKTTQEDKPSQPIVINNSKTITTRPQGDSRTGKVFTDDNTFNRLSMADSNHPQYTGFRG